MKTYMTDRTKVRNGRWYTPYHQDMDDIERRRANRSSSTTKLTWIIIWFVLLVIFL